MRETWDEVLVRAQAAVADLSELPVFGLSDGDVSDAVGHLDGLMSRLAGVAAVLVREAEARALPGQLGYTSVGVWLREQHRMSHTRSRQLLRLGRVLTSRPALHEAVAAGRVSAEQAAVVGAAVESLVSRVEPAVVDKAESALIGFADEFHPAALGALGERILGHVAPEIADEQDAARLARLESQAHEKRTLTLTPEPGTGRTRLSGWLSTEAAAIVAAALDPLAKPDPVAGGRDLGGSGGGDGSEREGGASHPSALDGGRDGAVGGCDGEGCDGEGRAIGRSAARGGAAPDGVASGGALRDPRTPAQRRADALVEVCRLALNTGDLPTSGGDRPQLTVTIAYDALAAQIGPGLLDNGQTITPETVRKLACDAQIIPAVLGARNQVLNLGRAARTWTGAARRALVLRDRGCAFPGCDRPARWTDAHHIQHWADGGPTDLDNGVLLCGYHHHLIHHTGWQVRLGKDRRPEFIPPPEIDPLQSPRRNPYHHRE